MKRNNLALPSLCWISVLLLLSFLVACSPATQDLSPNLVVNVSPSASALNVEGLYSVTEISQEETLSQIGSALSSSYYAEPGTYYTVTAQADGYTSFSKRYWLRQGVNLKINLGLARKGGALPNGSFAEAFEAEKAVVNSVFIVEEDDAASSAGYLVQPKTVEESTTGQEDAFINFDAPKAEDVSLWIRMYATSDDDDRIFAGFNGELEKAIASPEKKGDYFWTQAIRGSVNSGPNRVSLGHGEAGARIDLVVVTNQDLSEAELESFVTLATTEEEDRPEPTTGPKPGTNPPVPVDASGYPQDPYYKQRAFPGAEGYGANAKGGRGGKIEFITNRNNSGSGSAREAFEGSGKRYIIPLVWGYVDLQEGLNVRSGDFTYAGQFMPEGEGLIFRNMRRNSWGSDQQTVLRMQGAENAILRYLKIYRGVHSSHPDKGSCLSIIDSADVIVDHSAMAFCNDEEIGIWGDDTQRVTVQHTWPIMPLHYSTHPKTLDNGIEHGMGILAGGDAGYVSLHHNYFYLNDMRTPRLSGRYVYDVVNNYDYNTNSPIQITQVDEDSKNQSKAIKANIINNLREHGPYGKRTKVSFGMWIYQENSGEAIPSAYLNGNLHPHRKAGDSEWAGVKEGNNKKPIRLSSRVSAPLVRTTDPYEAKDDILNWGGPSYVMRGGQMVNVRDDLLSTAAKNARNGTGPDRALSRNNFSYPSLPSGGISEGQFWNDYFNPWRDKYYPGKDWDDYVEGYQIIEHFLNAWVPNFTQVGF